MQGPVGLPSPADRAGFHLAAGVPIEPAQPFGPPRAIVPIGHLLPSLGRQKWLTFLGRLHMIAATLMARFADNAGIVSATW